MKGYFNSRPVSYKPFLHSFALVKNANSQAYCSDSTDYSCSSTDCYLVIWIVWVFFMTKLFSLRVFYLERRNPDIVIRAFTNPNISAFSTLKEYLKRTAEIRKSSFFVCVFSNLWSSLYSFFSQVAQGSLIVIRGV